MKKVYKMVTTAHVLAVCAFSMQRRLKLKLSLLQCSNGATILPSTFFSLCHISRSTMVRGLSRILWSEVTD